jgi:hypothetical protein
VRLKLSLLVVAVSASSARAEPTQTTVRYLGNVIDDAVGIAWKIESDGRFT